MNYKIFQVLFFAVMGLNYTTALAQGKKIFCFGDSLTAGSSPPGFQEFPYGPHLEQKLRQGCPELHGNTLVRWKGYPGWTSKSLLEEGGLASTLDKIESSAGKVDLCIILAGTNDLAFESDGDKIFNSIKAIHEVAHSRQVPTLALAIPDSAWQQQSSQARELANTVNQKLCGWCGQSGVKFVPFPIEKYDRNSGLYCDDGLHFTPKGYEFIAEGLLPTVVDVLKKA